MERTQQALLEMIDGLNMMMGHHGHGMIATEGSRFEDAHWLSSKKGHWGLSNKM
jgi:hypothetical protein